MQHQHEIIVHIKLIFILEDKDACYSFKMLQSQPLTTDYGSSRPQSIVLTHSYSGGCIRLVALITHMGGHRYKLPPTVAGHIDNTIGYGNGGHSIMVLLTLGVIVTWRWPCHM